MTAAKYQEDADLDYGALPPLIRRHARRPELVPAFLFLPLRSGHAFVDVGSPGSGELARRVLDARLLAEALAVQSSGQQRPDRAGGGTELVRAVYNLLRLEGGLTILQCIS